MPSAQYFDLGNNIELTLETIDHSGKLKYFLLKDNKVVFNGNDYRPSPLTKEGHLSKYSAAGLLEFLFLKPGDTDEQYFEDYTEEQLQFINNPMMEYWQQKAISELGLIQLDNGDYIENGI